MPYRVLSAFIAFTFSFSYIVPPVPVYGQGIPATVMNLPVPGTSVALTPGFTPARIIGMTIHADNPLMFDFMVDPGDMKMNGQETQEESLKLVKYFLASLTVPAEKLWVNLSPYEKDKIVPEEFGLTEMGTELLAQDYMLKQLTASLMNPEDELGKKFWDRVYDKAQKLFGTTEIPMNTFNKVWIVPEKAVVYVNGLNVFVLESRFKVMLEEDYLALEHHNAESPDPQADVVSGVSSSVIKEVLLPEIEKEVNEGRTFAKLRQIQNSLILATWYKQNLKESLLGQIYADKAKTGGLTGEDKEMSRKIYEQYVEAFRKGVHNFIKEDYDPATQQIIPRKYFSGGVKADPTEALKETAPGAGELDTFANAADDVQVFTAGIESTKREISPDMTFVPGEEGESYSPLEWIPIPAVLAGLESEDWTVRAEAAWVLGQIGSSEAVDESTKALAISALKMALKDERDYVREMADQAINRIQKKQSASSPVEITIAPRGTEAIDVGKLGPETVVNHEGHVVTIVRKVGKDIFSTGSTFEGSFVALEKGQPRYFDQSGTGSDTRTKDAVLKIVSAEDGKFNVENLSAAGDVRVVSSSPVEITVDKLENVVIDVGKTISIREATWKGDQGIKVKFSDQRDGSKTPYPATVWVEKDPSTGVLATNVSSQGLFLTLDEKVGKDETAHFFGADGQRLYDSKNAVLKIVRQDGYIHITNHAAPGMTFSASSPMDEGPEKNKGGIDLNPGNMDMQTRGADRIHLPMPDIPLESIQIDGLVPVILHVAPVANLPLLLGLKSDGGTDEGSDVFRVIEQQPAEAPRRFPAKEAEQVSALN